MGQIRIGRLLGIPILVDYSWFFLFGFVTLVLASELYPTQLPDHSRAAHFALAAVTAIIFFASILVHELAHSVVAKFYRIPVKSITLFMFGGVAQITRDATKPLNELLMAAAGPLTSLAIGTIFLAFAWWRDLSMDTPFGVFMIWLGFINIVLGIFNLIPAFPMDGGRCFRALAWLVTGNYARATRIAAWTGRAFAWAIMATGAAALLGADIPGMTPISGMWFILTGLFIENAARRSLLQTKLVEALSKFKARDLMFSDPPTVDGQMSVASLARGVLEINPRVCYFVENEGALAGILSGYQMRAIPEALWDRTTAAEAMLPSSKLTAVGPDRQAVDLLAEMESAELTHLPVVSEGRVIGVVGRDRIINILAQAKLLD